MKAFQDLAKSRRYGKVDRIHVHPSHSQGTSGSKSEMIPKSWPEHPYNTPGDHRSALIISVSQAS